MLYNCFTPHDPQEDTERKCRHLVETFPVCVSPPTIRKRILKEGRGLLHTMQGCRFTPHDPQEDTESSTRYQRVSTISLVSPPTIRKRILKEEMAEQKITNKTGFTPHDPQEDTESCSLSRVIALVTCFTPHDPQEDTESNAARVRGGNLLSVSPPTIRKRILKDVCDARFDNVTVSFTPHDPQEDTERRNYWQSPQLRAIRFHPPRSARGY